MVKKNRGEAEGLSSSERKELKINADAVAFAQWDLLKQFLNENSNDYPLWNPGTSKRPNRPRIYGLRKTKN